MKRRGGGRAALTGALILFFSISAVVTVTLMVYDAVARQSGGDRAKIAAVMLLVIAALSALCTLVDFMRRRRFIDEPVNKILEATDRIAQGDFSVRLNITHPLRRYNEYDYIMENLNKMAGELARTEVLHSDFISNVSHELKTPLAVIQNYAACLQNADLDAKTREKYAKTLVEASKRLTALVTNILKLNKLENQQIHPEFTKIDLTEQLATVVLEYEDIIEAKKIELECDFEEGVEVISEASYLEIVWNNLMSNAVKFTPEGGKISVRLWRTGSKVAVEVKDTGCGISAETGKHVFEKFYQGETSHSGEGNGLGLALVKKVIDITGGEISVQSEPGKGAAFTVTLSQV